MIVSRMRSARAKSCAQVSFRLRSSPGVMLTGMPARSASSTSSAGSPAAAAAAAASRWAARIGPSAKPCGVWARNSPARLTLASTRPPSARHSASLTGRAGAAAGAPEASASTTPRITARGTSGRAASWISTWLTPLPSSSSSPARIEAARVCAPATSVTLPPNASMPRAMSSGARVTTMRENPAKASMLRSSTLRPASARHCLGSPPPARVPRPAAVMIAAYEPGMVMAHD